MIATGIAVSARRGEFRTADDTNRQYSMVGIFLRKK